MLLLDRLVAAETDFAICEWTVMENAAFAHPGAGIPTYVGVEYMAQCIAVHAGALARVRGLSPPLGFLLGSRHFKAVNTHFKPGKTYQVSCTELLRDERGMGSFDCRISLDDTTVADGRLAVLEKEAGGKLQ